MQPIPFWRFVTLFLAIVAFPALAHGRGRGADYYLVSRDGKLIRQLNQEKDDWVDPEAELVYRNQDGRIVATRFDGKAPLWSVPYDGNRGSEEHGGSVISNGPGVFVVITPTALMGYDKTTGKLLYESAVKLQKPSFPQWRVVPQAAEDRRFAYLVDMHSESVRLKDENRYIERSNRPPVLSKYDLLTGKRLWEKTIPAQEDENLVFHTFECGIVHGRSRLFYFQPKTGDSLEKIPTDTSRTSQLLFTRTALFRLSAGAVPSLTAYDLESLRPLWSLPELHDFQSMPPEWNIAAWQGRDPTAPRLLCLNNKSIVVIDTEQKKPLCWIGFDPHDVDRVVQTQKLLFLQGARRIRAVDPTTGRDVQAFEAPKDKGPGFRRIGSCSDDELVLLEEDGSRAWSMIKFSVKDGKQSWRWEGPPGHGADMVETRVYPCKSGYVVGRFWTVLD